MKVTRSKKFLILMVSLSLGLVMLVMSLGACGSPQVVTQTATSTATSTAVTTATKTTTSTATQTIKPTVIVFSSHDVKGGSWSEVYDPFFEAVEKRTNGAIKFEQHWGGELSGFFEAYDGCANGDFDMAQVMASMYANYFPLEDVTSIVSYQVKDLAVTRHITELASKYPEMAAAYEKSGTHLLWRCATFPNRSAMGKGKVVRSVADLKGKKYLSTGKWDAEMWTSLGMIPTSMMPTETFLNLQTGVVDGATLTLDSLFDFGWGEVVPTITDTNVRCGSFQTVMNLKIWNSLSKENQAIITEEAAKMAERKDIQQLTINRDYQAKAIAKWGTEFINLTAADYAEMDRLTAPVREKFGKELDAKGLPGTKILNDWLELAKKYAGSEYALK